MGNVDTSFANRVLRDMNTGVLVLNKQGTIIYTNKPARKMLEIGKNETLDYFSLFMDIIKDDSEASAYNDGFNEYIFQSIYSKSETHLGRVKFMSPSGVKRSFEMTTSYLENDENEDEFQIVITLCDVSAEEELRVKYRDSSTIFSVFLIGICLWLTIYTLWDDLGEPFSKKFITHGVEVLGIILLFVILKFSSLKWKDIGLFSGNPKRIAVSSIIMCGVAFTILLTIKLIFRNNPSIIRQGPFFNFSVMDFNRWFYIVTALVQEFLARGCVQSNLKRILDCKHPSAVSIYMASLVFAVLHIHLGIGFMVGAALLGGVLGIVYDKQETIWGVWIIHWFTGTMAALMGVFYK